jgi:hypothetical protein
MLKSALSPMPYWDYLTDSWLRWLKDDLRRFILPRQDTNFNGFTPFTRMKFFWLKAANAAKKERSLARLLWSTDGQSFQYSRPGLPPVTVQFTTLRKLVHDNLGELYQRFEQLLPSTFPISKIIALPWNELHNDASSSQSFLDTKEIWNAWMCQAADELKDAYLNPSETNHSLIVNGKLSRVAVDRLMALDQRFQEALVVDIVTNTGISPRAVTISGYRYRTGSGLEETRNLCLMNEQLALYGGHQKGQSRRDKYHELVARTFCQQTHHCVLPYLALFRAALVSILRHKNWYADVIPMYETYLIASPHSKTDSKGGVEVSHITALWHAASEKYFGAKLSIVDKRQIDDGIHKKEFPELLRVPVQTVRTAADGQGDHGPTTSANHYGRSSDLCHGVSAAELNDFIDASNIHHAFMQTGPISPNWPYGVLQALPFQRGRQEETATDAAYALVPHFYGFHKLTSEEISKMVKEICTGMTFCFRPDVSNCFDFWRDGLDSSTYLSGGGHLSRKPIACCDCR